jgi:mannose-6-phosphate isomerase-like protein (cupin superfamily)
MSDKDGTKGAIVRLPHEGTTSELSRAPGSRRRIIVGGDHTNGALGLSELTVPGVWGGPPEHIHRHFEEMFYVLEGTLELLVGDETVNASAGTFVIVPRGVMHKLSKRDNEPTRWLEFFVPAGFEQFFEQLATGMAEGRAAYDTLFSELASQHDVEFVG